MTAEDVICTYPLPPSVDFRTNATADAERSSLCLFMASNVFSSRSLLLSAKTMDSNISVTSSLTAVAAILKLNNGADLSFTEFLFSLQLIELDLSLEDVPLAPIPPGLASFICLCCDRIGLLLLLSATVVANSVVTTTIINRNFEKNIFHSMCRVYSAAAENWIQNLVCNCFNSALFVKCGYLISGYRVALCGRCCRRTAMIGLTSTEAVGVSGVRADGRR